MIFFNLKHSCKASHKTKNNTYLDSCALVRKCCPLNHDYVNKTCIAGENDFANELNNAYDFCIDFEYGYECGDGEIPVLLSSADPTIEFQILETGELRVVSSISNLSLRAGIEDYCLDFIDEDNVSISALLCQEYYDDFVAEMSYGKFS